MQPQSSNLLLRPEDLQIFNMLMLKDLGFWQNSGLRLHNLGGEFLNSDCGLSFSTLKLHALAFRPMVSIFKLFPISDSGLKPQTLYFTPHTLKFNLNFRLQTLSSTFQPPTSDFKLQLQTIELWLIYYSLEASDFKLQISDLHL